MNHNEPWYKHKGNTGIIYGNESMSVAAGHDNEIAQRIVDCVNACTGITNEALRAGYIKHLVEWDEVNHNCLDKVDSKVTPFEFKGVKILEDTK